MKKTIIFLIGLLVFSCQGTPYEWYGGTLEEAKEIAGSKLILIKFYTNT